MRAFPAPTPGPPAQMARDPYRRLLAACVAYNAAIQAILIANVEPACETIRTHWETVDSAWAIIRIGRNLAPGPVNVALRQERDQIASFIDWLLKRPGRQDFASFPLNDGERTRAAGMIRALMAGPGPAGGPLPPGPPGPAPAGLPPGLPVPGPPAGAPPPALDPLAGAFAVERTTRAIQTANQLRWTLRGALGSELERWLRIGPVGAPPTALNCWEAVLYIFLRAGLVTAQELQNTLTAAPARTTREVFTALFRVHAGPAAPGDVFEFVARRNGPNPPGYVGECQHVALVRGVVPGPNPDTFVAELDSTRGARPGETGRLHVIQRSAILMDLRTHYRELIPWSTIVRRFHAWP